MKKKEEEKKSKICNSPISQLFNLENSEILRKQLYLKSHWLRVGYSNQWKYFRKRNLHNNERFSVEVNISHFTELQLAEFLRRKNPGAECRLQFFCCCFLKSVKILKLSKFRLFQDIADFLISFFVNLCLALVCSVLFPALVAREMHVRSFMNEKKSAIKGRH